MSGVGHYKDGVHYCECGNKTKYRAFSGGREFWCPECNMEAFYPEGEGGPRARLLTQGKDGVAVLRAQMDQEIAKRKENK